MDAPRKRPPHCHQPAPPAPLVQLMPERRVRIDPSVRDQLASWIIALRARYERQACATLRGESGTSRKVRAGRIAWARMCVEVCDHLLQTVGETMSADDYEDAMNAIRTVRQADAQAV
jgi:hypothetical protein